jgi:predicted nuclease of predicted toxin-antitoxin system
VRFLIDTQLPASARALASGTRVLGRARPRRRFGAQAKDDPIWRYAAQHDAVIVTKDDDFASWVQPGRAGPSVVWLRVGNSSKRALFTWLEPLWPTIVKKLQEGERLIEVR